uniref:Zinc finger protein 786 n=1 Tax=Catagonus wagneri TaxID=51154 RepID=A0A8C3WKS2_9CETA
MLYICIHSWNRHREQVEELVLGPLSLTFEDVAIYFSEQEWWNLEAWQKELYKQVMRTNYEILVSLGDGLPKPELISWIEQGRELFRNWGESQKSGNITCSSADLYFDPVIEGQLLWGSQQTMNSGDAHCHFQVDPLQSQCSSEPLLGKNEDVSFRLNQIVILLNPHRYDTRSPVPAIHSSRKPTERERLPSPGTLGLTGFQEISREGVQHPCPDCGESFWQKSLLELHQGGHSKDQPHKASKQFNKPADLEQPPSTSQGQRHFRCPECGRGFRRKQCLRSPPEVHARQVLLQGSEGKMCGHHLRAAERPSPCLGPDESILRVPPDVERPVSLREDVRVSKKAELSRARSGEKAGLSRIGEECGRGVGGPEALELGPGLGRERLSACSVCGRRSSWQGGLAGQARVHDTERPFRSPECGRVLRRRRLHSEEQPFSCPECGLAFQLRTLLRAHQLRHGGERSLSCGECGRGFAHPCKLREHLRVHSGERPFGCLECGKSFRLKGILKAHERTHSRERPFLCGECGKGFTRPSKLEEHLRVHSGERPFDCADCGRRFRLKGQLRSHQRLHTGERPFPCPDCGKSYRVKADMKAHRLLHGGQMPFSCECGKGFTKQSKLVEHIRTHTGEKPFQCPQCDKSFRLKAQLLSHQGLHTGERPFHCPECNKNFREKGHMLRHQRIHRPERPFACADCGKGFIYKSKLAEHIRVHTKSCRVPSEPDVKKRLSQLFAMIEADWS